MVMLTLSEMKGSFLCSPFLTLMRTNSNSSCFSYREAVTRMVAVEKGLP